MSPVGAELVVDESCGLAVLRGADVFIPGILALPPATQPGTMVQNPRPRPPFPKHTSLLPPVFFYQFLFFPHMNIYLDKKFSLTQATVNVR